MIGNISKSQLVYDIYSVIHAKTLSDDNVLAYKHLSYLIDNTRSTLISQSYQKRLFVNPDITQTLSCTDVELVNSSYCPCEITGCEIYRTELEIPKTIESASKNLFTRVGSVLLGTRPYQQVSINRLPYIDGSKITKDFTKWFLHDQHLYFLTNNYIDKVSITGVFEYPEEAARFSHCTGQPCYTDDTLYPVSRKMVEQIKQIILNTNIRIEANPLTDNVNDANGRIDNTRPISTQKPQVESQE